MKVSEVHKRTGKELTSLVEYNVGVMGFHSLLQARMIPWESAMAKGLNLKIFKQIKDSAEKHNNTHSHTNPRLTCPMSMRNGTFRRNIHVTAIAPTMSISNLAGVTSSGIEPWISNYFTQKVKQGSFVVKNKHLDKCIKDYQNTIGFDTSYEWDAWYQTQWGTIQRDNGSVQSLDWMSQDTKDVFKTAFEIDQRWVIELAGDRQKYIDQAQSLNLFISGGSDVQYISDLHILAWKKEVKSLYYLRSTAISKASTAINSRQIINIESDECLSCT